MRKRASAAVAHQEERAPARAPSKLNGDLAARARQWLHVVGREADAHPLRTAGVAVGAGFVLGGGLFTPLVARTLSVGIRLALRIAIVPALTRGLDVLGGQLLEGSLGFASTTTNGEGKES